MLMNEWVPFPGTLPASAHATRPLTLLQELQARIMTKSRMPGAPFRRLTKALETDSSSERAPILSAASSPAESSPLARTQDECEFA